MYMKNTTTAVMSLLSSLGEKKNNFLTVAGHSDQPKKISSVKSIVCGVMSKILKII